MLAMHTLVLVVWIRTTTTLASSSIVELPRQDATRRQLSEERAGRSKEIPTLQMLLLE